MKRIIAMLLVLGLLVGINCVTADSTPLGGHGSGSGGTPGSVGDPTPLGGHGSGDGGTPGSVGDPTPLGGHGSGDGGTPG